MSDSLKPIIFYVDDEPNNLTVFEAIFPSEWDIRTFTHANDALRALETVRPWVIVSDQRMKQVNGVEFLQSVRQLCAESIRILTTGYSDESMVVESVKKAQIYDYIRKPWDEDELLASLNRAVGLYRANREARELHAQLEAREALLARQNQDLHTALNQVAVVRRELECWVPPFLLWMIEGQLVHFPIKKDIVGITFDIVGSSEIHDVFAAGKTLRGRVIHAFSETVLRHGGWRESHSGDSAYGHFGLLQDEQGIDPFTRAMAAAMEFRLALLQLGETYGVTVNCGVSLHLCRESKVDVHTVELETPRGKVTQKSFDTTSPEIDLLHRMEKAVHELPGTNIILSKSFLAGLSVVPPLLVALGSCRLRGQKRSEELYLLPGDSLPEDVIASFAQGLRQNGDEPVGESPEFRLLRSA